MKSRTFGAFAALFLMVGPCLAADPTGEWLVAQGQARIRIENCGNRLWGIVSWENEPGGVDRYNPDPAKQTRPTLGMPILLGMEKVAPNRWDGEIYNTQNGKTYTANISLDGPDSLRVQGCVLGFLCGAQIWSRAPEPTGSVKPNGTAGAKAANSPNAAGPPRRSKTAGAVKDVCSAVAAANGVRTR